MAEKGEQAEIANTDEPGPDDILFDCEHCDKSLLIDIRGAGLKIKCPDCNGDIYVPIPEGFDITTMDSQMNGRSVNSEEIEISGDQEESLGYDGDDESRNALLTELENMRFRTNFLEKELARHKEAARNLTQQVNKIRSALKNIDDSLCDLADKSSDDTQEL